MIDDFTPIPSTNNMDSLNQLTFNLCSCFENSLLDGSNFIQVSVCLGKFYSFLTI